MVFGLTCKISKNDIFVRKSLCFLMGDESPNAHDSKFMIGFVPSAQHVENAEIAEAKMEAKHQDHPNFLMTFKNM